MMTLRLPDDPPPHRPTWRDDFRVALLTIAMRVTIMLAVTLGFGVSLDAYARKGDGESYVLMAHAMLGQVDYTSVDEYHHRVFLGYPALMALLGTTGVSVGVAGLIITILSAAGAAVLAGRVFDDRRVGWASTMLVPHWVINSSLVMTEATTLCLSLLGVFFARRDRWIAAGAALAAAGLVRPMACFAAIAVLVALAAARRFRPALIVAATCGLLFVLGTIAGETWRGQALFDNVRVYRDAPGAYSGTLFTYPFGSLVRQTITNTWGAGYSLYIWLHVAFVMIAIALLLRRSQSSRRSFDGLALMWALGNTLFVLCIGSIWGYWHFPRFHILSQPALLYAYQRHLPHRLWPWLIAAVGVTGYAVYGVRSTP